MRPLNSLITSPSSSARGFISDGRSIPHTRVGQPHELPRKPGMMERLHRRKKNKGNKRRKFVLSKTQEVRQSVHARKRNSYPHSSIRVTISKKGEEEEKAELTLPDRNTSDKNGKKVVRTSPGSIFISLTLRAPNTNATAYVENIMKKVTPMPNPLITAFFTSALYAISNSFSYLLASLS
ncbi:unnamed protein product [Chondrus crispus]|uniref:Uncharacterized protein n=1 Tax=Chondrus crispus TaxID=2769 RepID=R7QPN2_CHOCR|nr:unnamed protein product [Chondrus crispus]CDF40442.1 unnamed protein product [Chondrus crispus]|eukprot:XP_005710736.1 unnamed protein product [Chondrus crispus]